MSDKLSPQWGRRGPVAMWYEEGKCRDWCVLRPGHAGHCVWTTDPEVIGEARALVRDLNRRAKGPEPRGDGGR